MATRKRSSPDSAREEDSDNEIVKRLKIDLAAMDKTTFKRAKKIMHNEDARRDNHAVFAWSCSPDDEGIMQDFFLRFKIDVPQEEAVNYFKWFKVMEAALNEANHTIPGDCEWHKTPTTKTERTEIFERMAQNRFAGWSTMKLSRLPPWPAEADDDDDTKMQHQILQWLGVDD